MRRGPGAPAPLPPAPRSSSARFASIQPLVRNGPSVLHATPASRDTAVKAAGEVFARVSPAALRALLHEERGGDGGGDDSDSDGDAGAPGGHARGGPVSVVVDAGAVARPTRTLLLDVRPAHAHAAARIAGAVACDPVRCRQDWVPAALALARTRADVAVVAYADEEGRELTDLVTKLCNLGFPHVAVVTGGLAAVAAAAPELLDGPRAAEYAARVNAALADRTRPPLHVLRRQQQQQQQPQSAPTQQLSPRSPVAGLLQSSSRLVAVGGGSAWAAGGGACESGALLGSPHRRVHSSSATPALAAAVLTARRSSSSSSGGGGGSSGGSGAPPPTAATTTTRRAASANNVFRGTGTEETAATAVTATAAAAAAATTMRRCSRGGGDGSVTAPASRCGGASLAATPGLSFAGAARFM